MIKKAAAVGAHTKTAPDLAASHLQANPIRTRRCHLTCTSGGMLQGGGRDAACCSESQSPRCGALATIDRRRLRLPGWNKNTPVNTIACTIGSEINSIRPSSCPPNIKSKTSKNRASWQNIQQIRTRQPCRSMGLE